MFFLPLDVPTDLGYLRLTRRERTVTFLPRESRDLLKRARNPARRICLHRADNLRDRLVLPQFSQNVNMVGSAVNNQRDSVLIADGSAEVLMNAGTNCGRQPWFSSLRRKDNVIQEIAIGGTHTEGPFRRPSSGAVLSLNHIPGVPLRSTSGCNPAHPSGAVIETLRTRAWPMALQRRRRDGIQPGVQRSETPGLHPPRVAQPLLRGDGERVSAKHKNLQDN